MRTNLPPALEPFRSKIQRATKAFIKLSRHPGEAVSLLNSKLCGLPYLPYQLNYPTDDNGKPLLFIAQVNFAEVPPLMNFPTQGILQFFLTSVNAQTCTVRYLPEPEPNADEWVTEPDLSLLMEVGCPGRLQDNPITRPGRLQFELCAAPPDVTDFHYERLFGSDRKWLADSTLRQTYEQWLEPTRVHKLGGYGRFVQGDPCSQLWVDSEYAEFEPILQLNSDEENFGLRWYDCQEICFLIRPVDLRQHNFSRIRYYLCP